MARPGRKRKPGERYPSGDLKEREDPRDVVAAARIRLYGIAPEEAKKREPGSAIGRALMAGQISQDQFEAGMTWAERVRAMEWAMDTKRPRSASDFSGAGGYDGREGDEEAYVDACRRARSKYQEMLGSVQRADRYGAYALNRWVIEDAEDYALIGSYRIAANAINRLLKLDKGA